MTIGGPQNIFPSSKEININFDWTNIASATGYVSYDCHNTIDSVGVKYVLIESSNRTGLVGINGYSNGTAYCITTGTKAAGAGFSKIVDIDWDSTEFKKPRTLRGKTYINFNVGNTCAGAASAYAIVKIRKWDGATETDILTIQSFTIGFNTGVQMAIALSGDISETLFKVGEQLRITIELWTEIVADTIWLSLSGQPNDQAESNGGHSISAGNTRIIAAIPFKIEQ